MKNTLQKLMQDLTFNRLIISLNIEPAPLFDIEVKDAEVVEPSNVLRFKEWYCERIDGKYKHDIYKMSRGYERVANYKINQNIINYGF